MTPPLPHPVVVDDDGDVWLPDPDDTTLMLGRHLYQGLRLGWTPMAGMDGEPGALLHLVGGVVQEQDEIGDAVATCLTRTGLRALIADFQAIEASLDGAPVT